MSMTTESPVRVLNPHASCKRPSFSGPKYTFQIPSSISSSPTYSPTQTIDTFTPATIPPDPPGRAKSRREHAISTIDPWRTIRWNRWLVFSLPLLLGLGVILGTLVIYDGGFAGTSDVSRYRSGRNWMASGPLACCGLPFGAQPKGE